MPSVPRALADPWCDLHLCGPAAFQATVGDDQAASTGIDVRSNHACMQEKEFLEDMARWRPDVEIEYDTYR